MSQIQKRMEALGVKQVDMILELRKRGITVQPPEMSSIPTRFSVSCKTTRRCFKMQRVIELLDKKVETLFNRQDFEYLLERYMGYEAVQYFRDMIEEIEDSYNGQIDELTVQNENLREKLEDIREVCRE